MERGNNKKSNNRNFQSTISTAKPHYARHAWVRVEHQGLDFFRVFSVVQSGGRVPTIAPKFGRGGDVFRFRDQP